MKKIISPLLFLFCFAQTIAQTPVTLKKVIELKMPLTSDDEDCGTRGANVVWHPVLKKYYAVFAGNAKYPLAIFDATGKRVLGDDMKALIDTRGLWYDPAKKLITGNAYSDYGWFTYKLSSQGLYTDYVSLAAGQDQPDAQSVGAYNPLAKRVMFLKGGKVIFYSNERVPVDSVNIHWNRKQADGPGDDEDAEVSPEDFNYTTVVYTGVKGGELGFLNNYNNEIELYDMKTGYRLKTLALPAKVKTEASFNFAYTNGIYWLFDMENRTWKGFR